MKNLGVSGTSTSTSGGGVAAINFGSIENCSSGVIVTATGSNNVYVGGVVDQNHGSVTNCYNTGNITVTGNNNDVYVGGVVAQNYSSGRVTNCYNIGTIAVTDSGSSYVGGIVGENDDGSVTNCYYLSANAENDGARTAEQFHSGEVAHLLGEAWGQDLSTDDSWPTLIALDESAQPVYQVTVVYGDYDNAPTTETSYTNDPAVLSETPTRDGYTFDSWKTTGEGTTPSPTPLSGKKTHQNLSQNQRLSQIQPQRQRRIRNQHRKAHPPRAALAGRTSLARLKTPKKATRSPLTWAMKPQSQQRSLKASLGRMWM